MFGSPAVAAASVSPAGGAFIAGAVGRRSLFENEL